MPVSMSVCRTSLSPPSRTRLARQRRHATATATVSALLPTGRGVIRRAAARTRLELHAILLEVLKPAPAATAQAVARARCGGVLLRAHILLRRKTRMRRRSA